MSLQLNLAEPIFQSAKVQNTKLNIKGQFIEGTADSDTLLGGMGSDLIIGWAGNDFIFGGYGSDWISGGDGDDWLFGGAGNDRLVGNSGADYMAGGTGDDEYVVEDPTDIVYEAANEGIDTVISYISYTLGENVENLTLKDGGNVLGDDFQGDPRVKGFGNQLDNVIKGNSGDNLLDGKAGNDSLFGGEGNDDVLGGLGSDTVWGEAGDDVLIGYGGGGTVVSSRMYQVEIDTLRGGTGADTFVLANDQETFYTHSFSSHAIVEDFNRLAGDRIRLRAADQSTYTIDQSQDFGLGSSAVDTAIYKGNDLIAILQDTTAFSLTTDVDYVTPITPPF